MTVTTTLKTMIKSFGKDTDDKVKANLEISDPQNHYQHKSGTTIKKLQASYNNNANKIIKQATKEKRGHQKFKFSNRSVYGNQQH